MPSADANLVSFPTLTPSQDANQSVSETQTARVDSFAKTRGALRSRTLVFHLPAVQELSAPSPDQVTLSADVSQVSFQTQTPSRDASQSVSETQTASQDMSVRTRGVSRSLILVIHHHVDLELCVLLTLEETPSVAVSLV